MRLSVIVTTYNRCDALNAVLGALTRQRGLDNTEWEVLVADDGSTTETASLITAWQTEFAVPLRHVWQEDEGFRAAAIRNKAAAQASGNYIIFLDGDCIPLADFVSRHLYLAEQGWAVAGSRILLSESFTPALLAAPAPWSILDWTTTQWRQAVRERQANKAVAAWRLPLGFLRKLCAKRWQRVRTCNLGLWRDDLLRINGFDEVFSGWGYEDSELAVRLIHAGIRIKDGRFAVPVLHLWHNDNDRSHRPENWQRFQTTLDSKPTRAAHGIARYLSS